MRLERRHLIVLTLLIVAGILLFYILYQAAWMNIVCPLAFVAMTASLFVIVAAALRFARGPHSLEEKKRHEYRSTLATLAIVVILLSAIIIGDYCTWHSYRVSIDRQVPNEEMAAALKMAENLDYPYLFCESRYDDGMDLENGIWGYPHFIDGIVLDQYARLIRREEAQHARGSWSLHYRASIRLVDSLNATASCQYRSTFVDWGPRPEQTYFDKEMNSIHTVMAVYNGTGFQRVSKREPGNLTADLTGKYLAEMFLDFWVQTYPLAGGGFYMRQYVFLDENLTAFFAYVERHDWVS